MTNAIAIITGAGGGIGRVICETLAQEGWTTIVNDISTDHCQPTVDLVRSQGGEAFAIPADVSHEASVEELFWQVKINTGRTATLLINNAGISTANHPIDPPSGIKREELLHVMNTNVAGIAVMTQKFLPLLLVPSLQMWLRPPNVARK